MSNEKLALVLRSWLKTRDVAPPDATQSAGRLMARLPQTRQRGRWWPLPIFGRASVVPPAIPDTEYQSTPIPATPIPATPIPATLMGGTHTMFSPVKAITAGALIFALGGAYLIAQPLDQQGGSVPGAAPDAEWAAVTATSECYLKTTGTEQLASPPYGLTDQVMACTDTASDPRVTGTSTIVLNVETWDPRQGNNNVTWNDYTLQGPEGTWAGHGYGLYDSEGVAHVVIIATGSGAYEGLTYTQSITVPAETAQADSIGLIQPGSPPPGFPVAPLPEPAAE